MGGKRHFNGDQIATISPRPQKKVRHDTERNLSKDSYTIAWICALPLEMAAARAMLDDIHEALPQDANDMNCYALGIIGKHNVAIACLPDGHYGTNNAAIVYTNMRRTFKNIQLGLMVGVGGGAPSKVDLRLGDIVVGSKVIQHDMGKAMGDGSFTRTSTARPVQSSISTVVSSLRSKHYSSPSRVSSILQEKSQGLQGFERPLSTDRLFEATYTHKSPIPDCVSCDQWKLVKRTPRSSNDPVIHYGAIASGNQVIKDSRTRDKLAQELDVICFEMEAAGLMDICPCLPIRGICDYSDSHKARQWQKYAAATAAAYAREFLDELPVSEHQQQLQVFLDEKDKECLRDLRITNPQDDKETIIKAKGGLVMESYIWIMENESYQRWVQGMESRLLWIKGDPGKGKTMLLCGIINELESSATQDSVFYFFCQASEPQLRTASAVLRGLIWLLAKRRPYLISHIRKDYDQAGKDLFNDRNSWQALSGIMTSMLDNETTNDCIFVIDALDECSEDRERLIELFTRFSSTAKAKWIVSSRNWPEIEAQLDEVTSNRVHLELNHSSIAEAVRGFIARRVEDLARKKRYPKSMRAAVHEHLLLNSNDTFLWVSLVCEELGKYNVLPHHTSKVLHSFPAGLDKLYRRMTHQLLNSRDEKICKAILAAVTVAFEPLSLAELAIFDERLTPFESDLETLSSIVHCCGSFLTIRNNIVYTVHQSVKDYLIGSSDIFPSGVARHHYSIFKSTIDKTQSKLHRNIYSAPNNTLYIHEIQKPPSSVLDSLRYGCIYWIDHLFDSGSHGMKGQSSCFLVEIFLKTKYLYWLEAMSLLGRVSAAIRSIRRLVSGLAETASTELHDVAEDALRFALMHRAICNTVPLQLYDSALIFCPEQSQVRQNFSREISVQIRVFPSSFKQWDACLFAVQNIAAKGSDLKVSPDGRRLAMTQDEHTILILDSFTGEITRKIDSDQSVGTILGFDANGKHLATVCSYYPKAKNVTIWNTNTGERIRTFENDATAIALSQHRMFLSLAERSGTLRVCDPWDGSCKYTIDPLHGKGTVINRIDFGFTKSGLPCLFSIISRKRLVENPRQRWSHDSTKRSVESEVVAQDPETGHVISRARLPTKWSDFSDSHAALDPNCKRLLITQQGKFQLWDGRILRKLRCMSGPVSAIAWAPDGRSFAMATRDGSVILYDPIKQAPVGRISIPSHGCPRLCYVNGTTLALLDLESLRIFRVSSTSSKATFVSQQVSRTNIMDLNPGPTGQLEAPTTFANNEIIISAPDNTLRRFHIPGTFAGNRNPSYYEGVFSADHKYAFVDGFGLINVWDTTSCLCLHRLRGHAKDTEQSKIAVQFDLSGQLVSANHVDGKIRIWNPTTGDCLRVFESQHWSFGIKLAASADGRIAITPNSERALYTWYSGCVGGEKTDWTLERSPSCLSFSSNGLLAILWHTLVEGSRLSILDVSRGTRLMTYRLSSGIPYARFHKGSDSRIDIGRGILDLDLERLTGAEDERFKMHSRDTQAPVWNPRFLRVCCTKRDSEAWLMKGSKKVLWVPHANAHGMRVTPNFDTGVSMVSMIYNRHALIIHVRGD